MAAWQGECYNPDLSLTEIAAIIRADLKKNFLHTGFRLLHEKDKQKN